MFRLSHMENRASVVLNHQSILFILQDGSKPAQQGECTEASRELAALQSGRQTPTAAGANHFWQLRMLYSCHCLQLCNKSVQAESITAPQGAI